MRRAKYWAMVVVLGIGLLGSSAGLAAPVLPTFDPADFVPYAPIDNPYHPFIPGMLFTYYGEKEEDSEIEVELNTVQVTFNTRMVNGIPCVVVRDTEWVNGRLVEFTDDWYAQDKYGNVWYMGEYSTQLEYSDEGYVVEILHEGSWEAGVDGAQPGYIMKGAPQVGDNYYQEYYVDEAEDQAEVLSLMESVSIDYGDFENCLQSLETTDLEPDAREYKFYAPGIGLVLIQELDEEWEPDFVSELIGVERVPEPATMSLLALGVVGLLRRRRRL